MFEPNDKGVIVLQGVKRKMPDSASPVLLQPVEYEIKVGTATVQKNAMTDTWFVTGQKGGETYTYECDPKMAARMALTVDHFNRTGERKKFGRVKIVWTKEK